MSWQHSDRTLIQDLHQKFLGILFLKTHTQALLLEIQIWGMCEETILKKLPYDFAVNP